VKTRTKGGDLWDQDKNSPVDETQIHAGDAVRTALLYAYLLRFPILTFLAVWPGLALAFRTPLFRGLADMGGAGRLTPSISVGLVSVAALSAALAAAVSGNLVLLYGRLRMFGTRTSATRIDPNPARRFWMFVPSLTVYLFLMWTLWRINRDIVSASAFLGGALLGAIVVVAGVLVVNLVQFRMADPGDEPTGVFLAAPFDILFPVAPRFRRLFERAYRKPQPALLQPGPVSRAFRRLLGIWGVGYSEFDDHMKPVRLLPGHLFALALVAVGLAVYFALGALEYRWLAITDATRADAVAVPTLFWVLALLGLLVFVIAAVGFFFDRYRVPTAVPLVAVLAALSYIGPTDHVFGLVSTTESVSHPPGELLNRDEPVIIVDAAGGGIQAAAWTARVLTGLQAELGGRFDHAVQAISGISGGSVGTLFYLRTLKGFEGRAPMGGEEAFHAAVDSSLEAVAWGLVFPDLQRVVFPVALLPWMSRDRGWALEQSIAAHAKLGNDYTMSALGRKVGDGMPAVMFNATAVETGGPVVFSNTAFPEPTAEWNGLGGMLRGFRQMYPDKDVLVQTAVRMSATFSWVSPAARSDKDRDGIHLVDGGYYDNYGLTTLMAWLRHAYPEAMQGGSSGRQRRILLVSIVSFPPDPDPKGGDQPWYFQATAPVETIYNARGAGQGFRNRVESQTFRDLLKTNGVEVATLDMQYMPSASKCSAERPPLSWHLTKAEIDCVASEWNRQKDNAATAVNNFLAGH
jgi:hypothetical protein